MRGVSSTVRLLAAFVIILSVTPGSALGQTPPKSAPLLDCKLGFEALKQSAMRLKGVKISETKEWTVIEVNAEHRLYNFTKSGHYAHPSAVLRQVVPIDGGAIGIKREACGYAGKESHAKLMREFDELDAGMKQAFGKTKGKK